MNTNPVCEAKLKTEGFGKAHLWIRGDYTLGLKSVLMGCAREGCDEIGYIINDESSQPEVVSTPLNDDWLGQSSTTKQASSGTRTREGDQVLPTALLEVEDDQSLLIADIQARRQLGIQRYGQAHLPWNGRDTLRDFYEEQLDALVYLRSIIRMVEATRAELVDVIHAILLDPDVRQKADESETELPAAYAQAIVDRIHAHVSTQEQK